MRLYRTKEVRLPWGNDDAEPEEGFNSNEMVVRLKHCAQWNTLKRLEFCYIGVDGLALLFEFYMDCQPAHITSPNMQIANTENVVRHNATLKFISVIYQVGDPQFYELALDCTPK